MNTIPATEAKAHFSAILDRVNHGEEFVLTRHGKGVAYLGPSQRATTGQAAQAVAELLAWRSEVKSRGAALEPGETIKVNRNAELGDHCWGEVAQDPQSLG